MNGLGKFVGVLLFMGLSACASAPPQPADPGALPTRFEEQLPEASAPAPSAEWWTAYDDPTLNTLEAEVATANPTLKSALAHVKRARAEVELQHAAGLPQVGLEADASRARTSTNIPYRGAAGHTINDLTLGAGASWEPDLFGRVANQVAAAKADAAASAADAGYLRISLQTELAQDYLSLRSIEAEQALLSRTAGDERGLLAATEQRLADGTASQQELDESNARLEILQTQIADLEAQRAALTHGLATLVGRTAATLELPAAAPLPRAPSIGAGIPSELLRRRPDVAAAGERVTAANARAGVARLAWFPSLIISVTDGLESATLGNLFGIPSHAWAAGPSIVQPLFDGGRRKALRLQADADVEAAAADYRGVVIGAINEVENDLSTRHSLDAESLHQTRAVELARSANRFAAIRYKSGTISYTDVLVAQQSEIDAERQALLIERQRLLASVALVRALGGGWQMPGSDAAP